MATNRSGTGKGGKSFQDRELAAKVRTLALNQVMQVLEGKKFKEDQEYHKALLLKLSGTLLPRLNEHSGEDGQRLVLQITNESATRYGLNSSSDTKAGST